MISATFSDLEDRCLSLVVSDMVDNAFEISDDKTDAETEIQQDEDQETLDKLRYLAFGQTGGGKVVKKDDMKKTTKLTMLKSHIASVPIAPVEGDLKQVMENVEKVASVIMSNDPHIVLEDWVNNHCSGDQLKKAIEGLHSNNDEKCRMISLAESIMIALSNVLL